MITYIKTAFTKPKEIYIGRNMKTAHFFLIFLLMAAMITLFSLIQFIPGFRSFNQDIEDIKSSIPDFEIESNQLESASDSYIYQTDSMIFYFDPEDRISTDTIEGNRVTSSVPVSVGLLKDELYFNLTGQEYSFQYGTLNQLSSADLKTLIASFGKVTFPMALLFILFLFLFNLFFSIYEFIPIVLIANIIAIYRKTPFRFFQTAKVTLLATLAPVTILGIINAFFFSVQFQFEIILIMSIIIFYRSITEMKERIKNNYESE